MIAYDATAEETTSLEVYNILLEDFLLIDKIE